LKSELVTATARALELRQAACDRPPILVCAIGDGEHGLEREPITSGSEVVEERVRSQGTKDHEGRRSAKRNASHPAWVPRRGRNLMGVGRSVGPGRVVRIP
jgi:hypothetical protein